MSIDDCFDVEADALEEQFNDGEITRKEYNEAMRELERGMRNYYEEQSSHQYP